MKTEIERRIREMEAPAYRFPRRFGRRDYLAAAVIGGLCLFMLIAGAYL